MEAILGYSWFELMQVPTNYIILASITRHTKPRNVSDVAGFPTGYV